MRLLYVLAQVVGAAAALLGLYLIAGLAVTLLVGGIALVAGSATLEYLAAAAPHPASRGEA